MKHARKSNSDKICCLPSSVIENILMFLPVRDAMRTSILSRKWRHHWKNIPQLVFDNTFGQILTKNLVSTRNKLLMNIYQVLLVHNAPILEFALSIPGLESCLEIDQLMLFLSRKNIQNFTLHIWGDARQKLHSCLFSYLQLTHLNLRSCVFEPLTTLNGFSSLISLEFSKVDLGTNFFSNLISTSPLLERLVLENCTECHLIETNAPKVKLFHFRGNFKSLYFKNTPLLSRVSIGSYLIREFEKQETSNMIKFFPSLPMIESIDAGYHFLKFMAVGNLPKSLPTPLFHLQVLELPNICFTETDEVISCVLCLIASAPNLQKIKFEVFEFDSSDVLINTVTQVLESEDYLNLTLDRLQEVEILSVKGTKPEMDLIMFLLAISPELERMVIRPITETDDRQALQILQEVTQFCRASPMAKIIFLDPNDDDDQA